MIDPRAQLGTSHTSHSQLANRLGKGYDPQVSLLFERATRRTFLIGGLRVFGVGAALAAIARGNSSDLWQRARWVQVVGTHDDGNCFTNISGEQYQANPCGKMLLHLCDGRHTGQDLVGALAAAVGISHRRARGDVYRFLQTACHEGLVIEA